MCPRFGEPSIGRRSSIDSNADRERQETRERFGRVLKGRFDLVRPDQFQVTGLPGVDALTITKVQQREEAPQVLNLTPIRITPEGKRHTLDTVQVTESGNLVGKFGPRMQGITKEQLLASALDIFETAGLGTYPTYNADVEILPGDVPTAPIGPEGEPFKGVEHVHDHRREAFLRKQDGALFMFKTKGNRGFGGMYVYVFDRFLYVDSELTENAAFFFDRETPIARDPNMPAPSDPDAFTAWVQQQPWFEPLRMPRTEAWKSGVATRKFHSGNWEQRVQEEIDKRRRAPQS